MHTLTATSTAEPRVMVSDELVFPEGLRWQRGQLWCSDIFARRVLKIAPDGRVEVVAEFDDWPSGLGFLPDGTPIVVLMRERRIVRLEGPRQVLHADLRPLIPEGAVANDMVVDDAGRAYIGGGHGSIVTVDAAGRARLAAAGVPSANGLAITEDGRELLYAATSEQAIVSASIAPGGELSNLREAVAVAPHAPDGICLDAQGRIWLGGLETRTFACVSPDGGIHETVWVGPRLAVACVLGGPDRRTLFMATAEAELATLVETEGADSRGAILMARVGVAGAGKP